MSRDSRDSREPKLLYRRLEGLFARLEPSAHPRRVLRAFTDHVHATLREELRLLAVVLYHEAGDAFERDHIAGQPPAAVAESMPVSLECARLLTRHRSYVFADPEAPESPHQAGVLPRTAAAGIVVGETPRRHLLFFLLDVGWSWETVDFTLNTVRVALSARLSEERVRGSFLKAAEIQKSLLMDEPPPFAGYDIACRSLAADEVGGDFYDFMAFETDVLGVSIGDASGHGMPAALLVRDVVTGLRMGLEKHLKVGYAFQKLNRVIHRSRLSSRFISVFYGELEANGNLIYVNAGHQYPLLFLEDRVVSLSIGGSVLGPLPEVRFKRGMSHVDRGATLLLLTDGLVEREKAGAGGEHFGTDRIIELVRANPKDSAAALLDRLFEEVFAWGKKTPWQDDATAVVIRRDARPKDQA
jgi:sigma-B regulation protein RsbU (phosphoserine phosphatase)